MQTIPRKQLPQRVASKLGRKRSVYISVTDSPVELTGTYWDGGSRSSWHAMDLSTGSFSTPVYVESENDKTLGYGHVIRRAQPTSGVAIVKLGTSCGKPATPHLYITLADDIALALNILSNTGREST